MVKSSTLEILPNSPPVCSMPSADRPSTRETTFSAAPPTTNNSIYILPEPSITTALARIRTGITPTCPWWTATIGLSNLWLIAPIPKISGKQSTTTPATSWLRMVGKRPLRPTTMPRRTSSTSSGPSTSESGAKVSTSTPACSTVALTCPSPPAHSPTSIALSDDDAWVAVYRLS